MSVPKKSNKDLTSTFEKNTDDYATITDIVISFIFALKYQDTTEAGIGRIL